MKVYVVTRGSYSDYQIDRVFATRQLAGTWIDVMKGHDRLNDEIEEFDVFEALPDVRRRYYIQSSWLDQRRSKTGVAEWTEPVEQSEWQVLLDHPHYLYDDLSREIKVRVDDESNRDQAYRDKWGVGLHITVTGWDQERVRKAFGEVKAFETAKMEGFAS